VTARIESGFHLLPETHEVYSVWRNLVVRHSVLGLRAYDARLVAAAIVHKVGAILTFNDADFRRFPEVKILHTNQLVSGG
jgi:predicted nucleic acid-binding protein